MRMKLNQFSVRGLPVACVAMATSLLVCATCQAMSPEENGIIFTPWWNISLGEGEEVIIDCGVHTGGNNSAVSVTWFDPEGNSINTTSKGNRIFVTLYNYDNDTKLPSAFTVLTLRIKSLMTSDAGQYVCKVTRDEKDSRERSIYVQVSRKGYVCGFESTDLCGWKRLDSDTSKPSWERRNGTDPQVISRGKGPRFDHTYGPVKTIGHFLDINSKLQFWNAHKPEAQLISPEFENHSSSEKCFTFWYTFAGKSEQLNVYLNHNKTYTKLDEITKSTGSRWKFYNITIKNQTEEYRIIVELVVSCNGCAISSSLDDVRLEEGACEGNATRSWPDHKLPVRLMEGNSRSQGRVEVLHDGQWGTICAQKFGEKDAKVTCRRMGYSPDDARHKRKSHFGQVAPNVKIWLNQIQCTGKEDDLAECISPGNKWGGPWRQHCNHSNDASVICQDITTDPTTTNETTTTEDATTAVAIESTTTSQKPVTVTRATPAVVPTEGANITSGPTPASRNTSDATEFPPAVPQTGNNSRAVAAGIAIPLVLVAIGALVVLYRKRKYGRKNNYITFNNPKYSREHLPTNEINLDSPLTWNTGHSVIA